MINATGEEVKVWVMTKLLRTRFRDLILATPANNI